MSILKFEDLPCSLSEFEIEEVIINKLELKKYEYFYGDYQAWVLECDCEDEKGITRMFALLSGDAFTDKNDVKNWILKFTGAKSINLIQHKSKKFDIENINGKMTDPCFVAEVFYN